MQKWKKLKKGILTMNNDENFAMKLVEKQLRRSEYHFYAVCLFISVLRRCNASGRK